MKKFILASFLIIFSLFVVFSISQKTFAQVASESAKSDYQLPYAGLLPDSPLYFFKALRDRVIEILISDPLKKSEFDLISADKRLSMGIALYDEKKYDLSETTISKAENYFEDGIKNINSAKKEGRQIDPSLLLNYDLSSKKHKEVLTDLSAKSTGTLKKKFAKDLDRATGFVGMVNRLKL